MLSRFMVERTFASLDEFYAEIKDLTVALQRNGFPDLGKKIHHHTFEVAWTTGSELLGELVEILHDVSTQTQGELQRQAGNCEYFAKNHRKLLKLD